MINKIKKVLKKKKEDVILDLYVKDYDKSNFYFAIIFNKKIDKYKVLFVPIDAINQNEDIEEYFCYQFIFVNTVETIIERLKKNESLIKKESNKQSIDDNHPYYIEINTIVDNNEYKLVFSDFINGEYLFLFDIIVILFEHSPHIVNELCYKLLQEFNNKTESFHYNATYDCNINDFEKLFTKEIKTNNKYTLDSVKFLEPIGNKYYGAVNNHLIIIDYNNNKNIVNVYSGKLSPLGSEVFIMYKAIKEGHFNDFYHIHVLENESDFNKYGMGNNYLSYGIKEDEFQIIDSSKKITIPLSLVKKKCIKIFGIDKELKKEIEEYLQASYEDFKVEELLDFLIEE